MGRWDRHPMASDGALDAQDEFLNEIYDEDIGYDGMVVRAFLQNISVSKMKKLCEECDYLNNDKFVIPFTFIEYGVFVSNSEKQKFLKECLDYHDDLTGPHNYCNGEEMKTINLFKENFEEIISGKNKELIKKIR